MGAHAFLSPSGASAWMRCHVKPWREQDQPDTSGSDAAEGTAAHELRAVALDQRRPAAYWLGETFNGFVVTAEMAEAVQKSVDVLVTLAEGGQMFVEQELSIEHITGEKGATGTCDTVILKSKHLIIDDYKHGMGVAVDAEENEQLIVYACAALEEFDVVGEIETVTMRISQPRINNDSEWTISVEELIDRAVKMKETAALILAGPDGLVATPGEKQCKFCKVKASCPELRTTVLSAVSGDFVDLDKKGETVVTMYEAEKIIAAAYSVQPTDVSFDDIGNDVEEQRHFIVKNKAGILPQLDGATERIAKGDDQHVASCMAAVDLIEIWCKSVRAEAERRMLAGHVLPGFKLVQGKKGPRQWRDESEAEHVLKGMRFKKDQMYSYKVISPTTAEKLLGSANPKRWAKLQEYIVQSGGGKSVAPANDKRPTIVITAAADDFEDTSVDDLV